MSISIIVPVLDEADRLGPCLEHLLAQPPEVTEILVVDGGSRDATRDLVRHFAARERRLRLLEAGVAPPGWNGKVWGLRCAEHVLAPDTAWVLTVDADVRLADTAATAAAERAASDKLAMLSLATAQQPASPLDALLHASLLTTLVYRFGRPGTITRDAHRVLANGQCSLIRRDVLRRVGGFEAARKSLCEDVTLARLAAQAGESVGFYESRGLASVQMYASWLETWRNWPRSLAVRDGVSGVHGWLGLLEVALVQALPLPLVLLLTLLGAGRTPRAAARLRTFNLVLLLMRVGMLVGIARAYPARPWTYWLSPVVDAASTFALWRAAVASQHSWRGRRYFLHNGELVVTHAQLDQARQVAST